MQRKNMIHKLKWKFIGIANASVFLVLIIVLLNVNLISYHKVTTDAYALLDSIYENDGSIPSQDKQGDYSYQLTPETRFETRYFILTCENGLLTLIGDHIAAVESDDLGDFANFINDKEDGNGMVTWNNMKYAYLRKTKDDGSVEMIFMDENMISYYSIIIISRIIDCCRNVVAEIMVAILFYRHPLNKLHSPGKNLPPVK